MTNAIRQDGGAHAGRVVPIPVFWITGLHDPKVCCETTDIGPDVGPRDILKAYARAFEALEHHLQQLPLLRVHKGRFEIVDPEEIILEVAEVLVNEVASSHVDTAGPVVTVGVVEAVDVPSCGRDLALAGSLVAKECPQV